MFPERRRLPLWLIVLAGAALVLVLLLSLWSGPGPNAELIRMAGEAVTMAHEAQLDHRAAILWAGRFRLLAIAIGVSVPLLVVCLIWRSARTDELDAAEILAGAERYALPRPQSQPEATLPPVSNLTTLVHHQDDPTS
jgi:hypothetical protein